MDFAALIAFGSPAVLKLVDFVKLVLARQFRPAITQAAAWAAGIGVAFVCRWSDSAGQLGLSGLNAWSCVLGGFLVASVASVGVDVIQSVDNSQSAAKPAMSAALFRHGSTPAPRQRRTPKPQA